MKTPRPHSATPRRTAFTLIEIMIAITIFGFVLISIYSSWTAILRASKTALAGAAEAQRTRIALRALREALSSAMLFTENLRHYAFIADTSGEFSAISLVAHLPASFPGSGLFGDQPIRRVSFVVEPGPDGKPRLMLRQSPLLEPDDNEPYKIVLSPSVQKFSLEFFDTNKFEWIPEWTLTNQLPRLVRVGLQFGQPSTGTAVNDQLAVETLLVTSFAIPRELQMPASRRGVGAPGIPPAPGTPGVPGAPGSPGAPPPARGNPVLRQP